MQEDEQFAKGFMAGYEAGLKEAYDQMIGLATKKCYTSTEFLLVVKNQKVCIPEKLLMQKRRILRDTGVDLVTEKATSNLEIEEGVTQGSSLFVKEQNPILIFKIFNEVVQSGAVGLCVTRTPPKRLKGLIPPGCEYRWLTKYEGSDQSVKDMSLQPNNLVNLIVSIKQFWNSNADKRTVVMMDGINFLISNNDFNNVLKMIQKLKDDAFMCGSVFIVSADPYSMQPSEVHQIENEMQNVFDAKMSMTQRSDR